MQYDMAYKRAQRLQNRSWAEIQIEAHKLAALGLEVQVAGVDVYIRDRGLTLVRIRHNGEILHHSRPGARAWHFGDIDDVAQALRDLLAQRQEQATTLAGVAGAMREAREHAEGGMQ